MSPAQHRTRRPNATRDDESVRQALERALEHAQRAAAEGVAGARALLDAASLGVLGAPADTHSSLGELAKLLDQLERTLSGEAPSFRNAAINTLLSAVDREVQRWERRSKDDPDARAVLRIFLGMREVLWEFGVRPPQKQRARSTSRREPNVSGRTSNADTGTGSPSRSRSSGHPRVQRIPIHR